MCLLLYNNIELLEYVTSGKILSNEALRNRGKRRRKGPDLSTFVIANAPFRAWHTNIVYDITDILSFCRATEMNGCYRTS